MDGLMEDFWYYYYSLEVSNAVCGFLLLYHVNRKGIEVFLPHLTTIQGGRFLIFSNHLTSKSKLKIIPSRERRGDIDKQSPTDRESQCKKSYSLHIMEYPKKETFRNKS